MPQVIDIPGVGPVEFPDGMSEADINAAAKRLHDEANPSAGPAPANRWVQKVGEGLVPGYNRLVAAADAALGSGGTFGDRYTQGLRALQAQSAQTTKTDPWKAGMLQGAGAVPTMFALPGAAPAASLVGRVAQGAAATAPVGAAYAAGDAPADATTSEILGRTAAGAAGAGALGAALPLVGAAAAPVARKLGTVAIEQGRKALSGIGTPLSARKPIPEAAVREALDSGAIRPFGTVTGTADRLEALAEKRGAEYGDILAELERQGVTGPNAILLADEIAKRAAAAEKVSLGSTRPGDLASAAAELRTKVDPTPFASKRLGLGQAEEIKRGLQREARREYDKISRQYTTKGETKKELASIVRGAIEDAVDQQSAKAPAAAASFRPVKERLANTLEALKHAEEGAGRAARRKPVSLTSTIAGAGMAGATGSPAIGLLSTLGHGVADARLASTLASGSNFLSNALSGQAAPSTAGLVYRAALRPEADPIVRALAEALMKRELALGPATAGEEAGPQRK